MKLDQKPQYVRLKICLPDFGEYSINKFSLITIRPRIREPFTLERLHLFNFLYFLYFSAGPLFLTHFSDRSSSQRRTVPAQNSKLEQSDSHISELSNLCAMSVLCSTCSFPVLPPLLQCHPHLVNGPCIALCTIVCARCTLQRAQRAHRPAHKPVLRPPRWSRSERRWSWRSPYHPQSTFTP